MKGKVHACMLSSSVLSDSWRLMDCSSPGSSVHGILQARILEWVAMPSSRGSSQPTDQTGIFCISCIGRWILYLPSNRGSLKVGSRYLFILLQITTLLGFLIKPAARTFKEISVIKRIHMGRLNGARTGKKESLQCYFI